MIRAKNPDQKTVETNSAGYFAFEDVNPGNYVISESFVVNWLFTTDASYNLNVPLNSTSVRKDFGNSKLI